MNRSVSLAFVRDEQALVATRDSSRIPVVGTRTRDKASREDLRQTESDLGERVVSDIFGHLTERSVALADTRGTFVSGEI